MFENGSEAEEMQPVRQVNVQPVSVVTLGLIAVNVLIFVLMVASGLSPMHPDAQELIPWGASFGPLTMHGQPWRLFTACFLHFGIVHLGFNMYVLFQVGMTTELLYGRAKYLLIYIAAGLGGNLASLYVHPMDVGAGASGAIFGVYGAFLGFLLIRRKQIHPAAMAQMVKSAVVFLGINLVYGLADGSTDLSAHIGGLAIGFLLGCPLAAQKRDGTARLSKGLTVAVAGVVFLIGAVSFRALAKNSPAGGEWFVHVMTGPSVPLGKAGRLIYVGTATKADAERLAQGMDKLGIFANSSTLAVLSKGAGGTTISFSIGKDESVYDAVRPKTRKNADGTVVPIHYETPSPYPWDEPTTVSAFDSIGIAVAPLVGGPPIKVLLLNHGGELRRTIDIDTRVLVVGTNDKVWYSGAATEQDAAALGKALQSLNFFNDKGARILLSKGDSETELTFNISDAGWDNPRLVSSFEVVGRKLAASVGGLPITIHLNDSSMQTRQTIVVK